MNRVKELRKKNGLSQQRLAQILNVHQTAISQWETGRTSPDIEIASKMSELFNVSLETLLGLENGDSAHHSSGVRIPVYGETAAGIPIMAIENYDSGNPDDWEEISESMANSENILLCV